MNIWSDFNNIQRSQKWQHEKSAKARPAKAKARPAVAGVAVRFPEVLAVLVAYSGGKDSLVVLDLSVRAGKRVEAFFMYFLPGMDYTTHWCAYARKRWGIIVHEIQHWNTTYYLRRGVFRSSPDDSIPKITILDIEREMRARTGIEWIGYGYKSFDSLQRRGMMNRWPDGIYDRRKIFAPIKGWNDSDVKAYLSANRMPIPGMDGKRSTGLSLTPSCLEWLRSEWPEDYRRVLKVFPYAEAQADRAAEIREHKRTNKATAVRIPGDSAATDQLGAL